MCSGRKYVLGQNMFAHINFRGGVDGSIDGDVISSVVDTLRIDVAVGSHFRLTASTSTEVPTVTVQLWRWPVLQPSFALRAQHARLKSLCAGDGHGILRTTQTAGHARRCRQASKARLKLPAVVV